MIRARITAAVHCAPPDNKPTPAEFDACSAWLRRELDLLNGSLRCVVALGGAAWVRTRSALRSMGWQVPTVPFGHGAEAIASLDERPLRIIGSYHPSQQNTFTGRLTEPMLDEVFHRAADHCA